MNCRPMVCWSVSASCETWWLILMQEGEKMNVLTKDFLLVSDFCDRYGRWKPSHMLVAMQELAGEHSEAGGGARTGAGVRAIWVLARSNCTFIGIPCFWIPCAHIPTAPRHTLLRASMCLRMLRAARGCVQLLGCYGPKRAT